MSLGSSILRKLGFSTDRVDVSGSQVTVTGVSTAANQTTANASLATIAGKDFATQTTLAAILAELRDDVFVTAIYWEDRSSATAVFYREERTRSQDDGTITTVYTRLSDNTVVGSLPAGCVLVQGANDRTVEAFRYKAIASGTGYSTGDWLINTLIYDTDGNGSVVSSTWYNLSTSAAISAPAGANIQAENEDILSTIASNIGTTNETVAASDTATSGLNGLFKRFLQRITTLIGLLPTALGAGGGLKVDGSGTALPVSGTVTANAGTNLNTSSLALEAGGNLAAIFARLARYGTAGTPSADVISVQGVLGGTAQPISNSDITAIANNTKSGSSVYNGKTVIATDGTAIVLASNQAVTGVQLIALSSNLGLIYVGNSGVTSSNGLQLQPGAGVPVNANNLNLLYINGANVGDGVTYIATN